jgi:hypothetical protein
MAFAPLPAGGGCLLPLSPAGAAAPPQANELLVIAAVPSGGGSVPPADAVGGEWALTLAARPRGGGERGGEAPPPFPLPRCLAARFPAAGFNVPLPPPAQHGVGGGAPAPPFPGAAVFARDGVAFLPPAAAASAAGSAPLPPAVSWEEAV